mmetsp:Transcript_12339/g.25061  ORF Transcript_12339/g.25061 Transcript_12339/m.25061 type:complete len:87 (+) Transcript_12339:1261-1521(+)
MLTTSLDTNSPHALHRAQADFKFNFNSADGSKEVDEGVGGVLIESVDNFEEAGVAPACAAACAAASGAVVVFVATAAAIASLLLVS